MASIGTPFNFTRGFPTSTRIGTPFNYTRGISPNTRIGTPFNFARGFPTSTRIGTPYSYKQLRRVQLGALVRVKQLNLDLPLPSFISTVAGVPDPEVFDGHIIYVTDEAGGAVLAFSDGSDWRRVTDRAIVS